MPKACFHHPSDVLRFAAEQARGAKAFALVIVTDVTGGAMRGRGAMMCVTGEQSAGYVSNGCVDADIIFQARELLSTGEVKRLSYGEGSPFKDITLPCGGRIDVLITANVGALNLEDISKDLDARRAAKFTAEDFTTAYTPPLRLRIVGRGEAVRSLARQSHSAGFSVVLQSPDAGIADGLTLARFDHLTDPSTPPALEADAWEDDAWTAVIVMFHDHEWEPYILAQACRGPAFYIGAMGSPRTHDLRKAALEDRGLNAEDIARVHGPIGLIPSMRDANLLALSTLAEVVDCAYKGGKL